MGTDGLPRRHPSLLSPAHRRCPAASLACTQGLESPVEKRSDVLGRNAEWKEVRRVKQLPRYLCVQFMRFFWKETPQSRDQAGVKCKIMRVRPSLPTSYPVTPCVRR